MSAVDAQGVSWSSLLSYGLSRVVPAIVVLAATPILVGLIGAAQYGLYTTVTALVLVAQSLGVGWLRQSALRGAGDPGQAMRLLPRWSVSIAVVAPAATVAVLLNAFGGPLHLGEDAALLPSAAALCGATGVYVLFMTRAQRDMQAARVALAEGARAAVGLLATIAVHGLLLHGASAALAGMTIGNLAGILVMVRASRQATRPVSPQAANSLLKSFWSYGWPMSLWLGASSGLLYVDRLVLSFWLGPEAAGHYGAVADVVIRGFAFIASPVSMAVHPLIMSAWNRGRPGLALGTLATYQKILGLASIAAAIAALALGPWLIPIAAGVAVPPLTVLFFVVIGSAVWQYGLLTQKRLELAGRSLLVLGIMGVSLLLTVVVDVALVPVAGPLGSALGLTAGAAAYQAGCLHFGRRAVAQELQRGGPVSSSVSCVDR